MSLEGVNNEKTLATPIWVFALRIAQVVLSIVVLGMAAAWSDYLFDGPSLAIAAAVFTWVIVAYILVTEKVPAANALYSVFAVIALDAFMCIIWLSAWALNAARRASLGNVGGLGGSGGGGRVCYNGYCVDYKRSLHARSMSWSTYAGLLAGVAALGAIIWVMFIVTLVWTIMSLLKGRKEGRFTLGAQSTTTAEQNMEEQKVAGVQEPAAQPATNFQEQPVEGQYQQPQQYPHDPNQVPPQQHQ